MNNTLINGREYGFSDVRANILGRTVEGFSAISYGDMVAKQNHKGRGGANVSRGRGDYDAHCNISISMKESEGIQALLPRGKRIQDIAPFDVTVVYDPEDGTPIVKHVIVGCEFTDNKREVSRGDTEIDVEYELIVGEINWNA